MRQYVIAKVMPDWGDYVGRWALWGRESEWTRKIGEAFIYDRPPLGGDLFHGEVLLTLDDARAVLALDDI